MCQWAKPFSKETQLVNKWFWFVGGCCCFKYVRHPQPWGKCKLKWLWELHLILVRTIILKKTSDNKRWQGREARGILLTAGGNTNRCSHYANLCIAFSPNWPTWPSSATLGLPVLPRRSLLTADLVLIAKKRNRPSRPAWWVDIKMQDIYIHMGILLSHK